MVRAGVLVLAIGLMAAGFTGGWLALQSCGIRVPLLSGWIAPGCAEAGTLDARERLALAKARHDALQAEIRIIESNLSQITCEAVYPEPEPPAPAPLPERAEAGDPAFDPDAWRARDLSMLDGCWELDSDYRVQDIRTGVTTNYTEWNMCFDGSGQGRVAMRATNGTTCQGPISGAFDGEGRIVLTEPANLGCSDRSAIFQRIITCSLAPDGGAECSSHQPEAGRTVDVRLRRGAGAQ